MSREGLAVHSGISAAAIAQIESGRRRDVRLATLVALARALGVTVDYLAGGSVPAGQTLLQHRVLIYDSDEAYLEALTPVLTDGIRAGEPVLVVTGERQVALLRGALGDAAAGVEFHDSGTWYESPIAALDAYRSFIETNGDRGVRWCRIVGEPVWKGRSRAAVSLWTRYESMLNLTLASSPATVVCPYDARTVSRAIIAGARHTHPQIEEAGAVLASADYRPPESFLLG